MYEYKATVIKVIDGDTLCLNIDLGFGITYNNQKVRLARINTLETTSIEGLKVKELLTNLLLNKTVIIETIKDKKDKYGRYLVEVFIVDNSDKKININDYLLTNNFAIKYE